MNLNDLKIQTTLAFAELRYRIGRAVQTPIESLSARPLELEQLEDRVLFSASPVAAVMDVAPLDPMATFDFASLTPGRSNHSSADTASPDATDLDSVMAQVERSGSEATAGDLSKHSSEQSVRHELVFVDLGVDDFQQLLNDLWSNDDPSREFEVVLLQKSRDGVEQISEALASHSDLDAVHIVSHGTDKAVKLGSTWLTPSNLDGYAREITSWSNALSTDADLLFYGCDLAATSDGQLLVDAISTLTGADVAASDDLTGHKALGGDWDLEFSAGTIETGAAFSQTLHQNWGHLLSVSIDATSTGTSSGGDLSFSHTTAGTDRLMLVGVSINLNGGSEQVSSITYNGDALALVDTRTNGDARVEIWSLVNPDLGMNNVDITMSGTSDGNTAGVMTFTSVDQTIPLGAFAGGTGSGGSGSATVISAANELVFGTISVRDSIDYDLTPGGSQTEHWDLFGGLGINGSAMTESGAASVVTDWTWSGNVDWAVGGVSIKAAPVNVPPTITSNGGGATAPVNVAENRTAVTTVTATDADLPAQTLTYSINGGADATKFNIESESGELTFDATPDFEAPTDANLDNIYEVAVLVSDGNGGSDTQTISVTVTNVVENFDGPATAIWSEALIAAPQTAEFNGTLFSDESNAGNIGGPWRVVAGAESPTRDEKILLGVDAAGNISGQQWNGTTWSTFTFNDMATVSDSTAWGFAVAYEAVSGDAVMVWNNGTTGTDGLSYRVWNGTSWSAEQTITTPISGEPVQMRLAAASDSDEMVLVVSNATLDDYALVWDGTGWGNARILDALAGATYRTDVFVEYERTSGDAIVVYGTGTSDVASRVWDGVSWSSASTVTAPGGVTGEVRWNTLAADPNCDHVVLGVRTDNNETWLSVWDGSAWGNTVLAATTEVQNDFQGVAVAFEAESGDALAAYTDDDNKVQFRTWSSGGGWSLQQDGPDLGHKARTLMLSARPDTDQIVLAALDNSGDVNFSSWDGDTWSDKNELESDSGETFTQPFLFLWDRDATTEAAVLQTGFWLSTKGDVDSDGAAGLNSWTEGEALGFGDPNLSLDPVNGTTSGTLHRVFNLDAFGGDTDIDAMHYVTQNLTVGTSNFDLFEGDVLLSTDSGETLTSTNTLTVDGKDVFVFRPDTAGDYSSGTFLMLLDEPEGSNIRGVTLIEQNTTVGDITLQAGDFLLSTSKDIQLFQTTDVGELTTTGTVQTLLDGGDPNIDIGKNINGIDLIETETTIGGHTLTAGTILLTVDGSTTVGSNSLHVDKFDLFAINVTQTTLVAGAGNGAATATLILEGVDVGLASGSEQLVAITTVPSINNAPTITSIADQTPLEDTPTGAIAFTVGDVETAAGSLSVTATSNDQTLVPDGNITLSGSGADRTINVLPGLNQTGGPTTITVTVDDGTTTTQTMFDVTVTAVNDAPVLSGLESTQLQYDENDGPVAITTSLSLSDIDDANIERATVRLTVGYLPGEDVLDFTDTGTISGSFDVPSGTLTLTGTDSVAAWQAALRSVTYENSNEDPTLGLLNVGFTVNDGDIDSNTVVRTIRLTPINDAPQLSNIEVTPLAYNEDDPPTAITDNLSISDFDDTQLECAIIQITSNYVNGEDVLAFTDTGSISGTWDSGTGTLTLTGTALLADYQTALRSVTYVNLSDDPDASTRQISFTAHDGNEVSNILTRDIDVTAVNDVPVNSTPGAQVTDEDTPLVFGSGNGNALAISDVDAAGSVVRVSLSVSNGTLTLGNLAGLTFISGDGIDDLSMTLAGTITDINAALEGLTYDPTLNFNGGDALDILTDDLGNSGSGTLRADSDTVDIMVNAINDAPVTISDNYNIDEDSILNLSSGVGVLANDTDVEDDPLTSLLVSGTSNGIVILNPDGSLTYTPDADFNGVDAFTYSVFDGEFSRTETATITVDAVNDAPVNQYPGLQSVNEDEPLLFSAANGNSVTIGDVDVSIGLIGVRLTATNSTITLGSSAGLTFALGDGIDDVDVVFAATLADSNAALAGLIFLPDQNYNGPASIDITSRDMGNSGQGAELIDQDTISIDVLPVNDAPVGATDSYTLNEDETLTLTALTGVLANDSDVDADTLSVTLVSGPASGALTFNADGAFTYTPDANVFGNDSFSYFASDGQLDTGIVTVSLAVASVNDAPVTNADVYDVIQAGTLSVAPAGLLVNDSDVEGETLSALLVSGPSNGSLLLNADGSFEYVPTPTFSGEDSFTYRSDDGTDLGSEVTVSITVTAATPTVTGGDTMDSGSDDKSSDDGEDLDASDGESSTEMPGDSLSGPALSVTVPSALTGFDQTPELQLDVVESPLLTDSTESYTAFLGDASSNEQFSETNRRAGLESNGGSENTFEASLNDANADQLVRVLESGSLWRSLDSLDAARDQAAHAEELAQQFIVGTTGVAGTTLTVGYVVWLLRGGSLIAGLVSSLPVWTMVDPLPVLESLSAGFGLDEDGDSIESLLKAGEDSFA